MRAKSYDVTPEMVSKLEDGLSFSNFTELSKYLGVLDRHGKSLGGNSKKQFLAELNRYVEYQIDDKNRSYTIIKIRPKNEILPPRATGGNNKFSLQVQNMIAYHLLKGKYNKDKIEYFWSSYDLFQACGMTSKQFYRWSQYYCEKELRSDAITFRYNTKSVLDGYVKSALNAMQRNKEIVFRKEPFVLIKKLKTIYRDENGRAVYCDGEPVMVDAGVVEYKAPSEDQIAIYMKMQNRVIQEFKTASGKTCHSEQEIFLSNQSDAYYERMNEEFQKIFPYDEARPMYHIITEPTSLLRAMKRIQDVSCVQEFKNINQAMCENLPKLSSVKRGRSVQVDNPDYDSNNPDNGQSQYIYECPQLTDDAIQLFIDYMIRTRISIDDESEIPSSGLRTPIYELHNNF